MIPPHAFVFVEERRFLEPVRPTTVVVNNTTMIDKTVNITNIKIVNNTVINEGPRTQVIERASGQKVRPVPVHELRRAEEAVVVAARQQSPSNRGGRIEPAIQGQTQPRAVQVPMGSEESARELQRKAQEESLRHAKELEKKAQLQSEQHALELQRKAQEESLRMAKALERKAQLESQQRTKELQQKALEESRRHARELEQKAQLQSRERASELQRKAQEESQAHSKELQRQAQVESERRATELQTRAQVEFQKHARELEKKARLEAQRRARQGTNVLGRGKIQMPRENSAIPQRMP